MAALGKSCTEGQGKGKAQACFMTGVYIASHLIGAHAGTRTFGEWFSRLPGASSHGLGLFQTRAKRPE